MALILNGDCLTKMKEMADNSVDSIVTDPPYGLSFMGKKWDYDVPSIGIWREALRVLKPGGHLLAFSGSRTYHRMVVNIEDAGFEVRDQIMWLYGSGFPKSLNVSKAIDKHLGAKRETVRKPFSNQQLMMKDGQNERPWQNKAKELGYHETVSDKPASPEAEKWDGWGTALKPAHEPIVLARKPITDTIAGNVLEHGTGGLNINESRIATNPEVDDMLRIVERKGRDKESDWAANSGFKNENNNLTGVPAEGRFPANVIHDGSEEVLSRFPEAGGSTIPSAHTRGGGEYPNDNTIKLGLKTIQRTGFDDKGSASRFFKEVSFSKQEHKPIVLARKPLEGTVAENVLAHNTGAINIDDSRIVRADGDISVGGFGNAEVGMSETGQGGDKGKGADWIKSVEGRFPANVIHDGSEEIREGFPKTSFSNAVNMDHTEYIPNFKNQVYGKGMGGGSHPGFNDTDESAARFFYCAKASKSERNAGIEEAKGTQGSKGGGLRRVCEFCGAQQMNPEDCSCEVKSWINPLKKNFHPTVKPIALMEYLCRLITPPGGTILDPFMGSGTTGIAALRLGFEFIGIELSEEYVEIATARIAHWVDMELEFDDEDVMLKRKPQAEWL